MNFCNGRSSEAPLREDNDDEVFTTGASFAGSVAGSDRGEGREMARLNRKSVNAGLEGFSLWAVVAFVLLLGLAAANSAGWIVPMVDGDVYGPDELAHLAEGRLQ